MTSQCTAAHGRPSFLRFVGGGRAPTETLAGVCLVAGIMLSGGRTLAADLPPPLAPLPTFAALSWAGVYAGVQAGYDWNRDHLVETVTATGAATGILDTYHPDGFAGGAHVGANLQFQSVVVGAVADFEGTTLRGTFTDPSGIGRGRDVIPWQGSVRGLLGYAFDTVMVYATGGFAYANVENTYVYIPTDTAETFSKVATGWTIGGGLQYAFDAHWIGFTEYRFTEYGRVHNVSTVAFPGLTGAQELTANAVKVGVSYRF